MEQCSKQLAVDQQAIQLFALVPLTQQLLADQLKSATEPIEIAVRLTKSSLNIRKFEQTLIEK